MSRKKILMFFFITIISYLVCFFLWKRQFRMDEMEKWVVSNSWEWESGASILDWSIISEYRNKDLQYRIENLHIKFLNGKECIVIWAYGNTLIVRDPVSKRFGFYERLRGSSRWHDIFLNFLILK